ncbi:hypothetical protein B0H34DRAFT_796185 [Crassisporium funariophilum]|nr:hypothetical protein B0H34DRAFT_796185 [Crassisporium funariophilum]
MSVFDPEKKAALLRKAAEGMRRIHCTEILSCDVIPFIEGREKLGGTAIDAIASQYQALSEVEGRTHWAVLSTWFGPIVRKQVVEGRHVKTTTEYVQQAANHENPELLLAKTLWVIPLLSEREPKHWVTGWIDWGRSTIGIFDSIPEYGSSSWAVPLLTNIVDHIRVALQKEPVEWKSGNWTRVLEKPASLQRQMDDWSCGYYVLMRIRAIANSVDLENARFDERETIQREAAEILVNLPLIRPKIPWLDTEASESVLKDDDDELVEMVDDDEDVVLALESLTTISEGTEDDKSARIAQEAQDGQTGVAHEEVGIDDAKQMVGGRKVQSTPYTRPSSTISKLVFQISQSAGKRKPDDSDRITESDVPASETKRAKSEPSEHPALSSLPRRSPTNCTQRKVLLEADPCVLKDSVKESSVKCAKCRQVVKLNIKLNKAYEWNNWEKHKNNCPQITGNQTIRTGAKKDTNGNTIYQSKIVKATPAIFNFFSVNTGAKGASSKLKNTLAAPPEPEKPILCHHLTGTEYESYISLTHTRQYGGISPTDIARTMRCLFPYKNFSNLEGHSGDLTHIRNRLPTILPAGDQMQHTNNRASMRQWTSYERQTFQEILQQICRWEVNYTHRYIKSTKCEGETLNLDGICNSCNAISKDKSLQHAIRKKNREAKLPPEVRQEKIAQRTKYAANNHVRRFEHHELQDKLADPVLFDIFESLKTGKPEDCFLQLFKQAHEGKLQNHERFLEVCEVLSDRIRRDTSGNRNLKYGMRYSKTYLDFMIAMRGYGQNSNRQYEILAAEFCGPSVRHLRALVSKSIDALQNPYLIFENVARVKRYVDSINYKGPIIVGSDCTKVRKRLNFSTQHGLSHILGTVFDLSEVEVEDEDDLEEIVERTIKKNAHATQARAIISRVPLPGCPSIVVALLPTNGKEDADTIHGQHLKLQAMARQVNLPLTALAADGAAVELAAQLQMDHEQSNEPPLIYQYPLYGISLSAPVFTGTGPLISITDPPHARKTCRNQPQYGTHTASLGVGHLVNQSLVDLYRIPGSGLVIRDVENVDKQDDGAARRMFHLNALKATTSSLNTNDAGGEDAASTIRPGFEGIFAYLFVMGSLFEAWMNPKMTVNERVVAALRARFWLHYWHRHIENLSTHLPDLYSVSRSFISPASFQIFNRLCDTLILLALAYSLYYPDIPFCPWLFGTEFVEHFFGIARQLLPNFSYAEFLKIVQHTMVRQRILESGILKSKRERDSASGYIFDHETDMRKASQEKPQPSTLSHDILNQLVKVAHDEASHICRDILFIPIPRLDPKKPLKLRPLGASASHKMADKDANSVTDDFISEEEILEDEDNKAAKQELGGESQSPPSAVTEDVDIATKLAAADTARYAALCSDLDEILTESGLVASEIGLPVTPSTPPQPPTLHSNSLLSTIQSAVASDLLDATSNLVSVKQIIRNRAIHQSGTGIKSERSIVVGSRYALQKVLASEESATEKVDKNKLSLQEAAHRLRIAQEVNPELKKFDQKKARQWRWETVAKRIEKTLEANALLLSSTLGSAPPQLPNIALKNVTAILPLQRDNFLIMRSERRFYIGQVLDIYKRGANSRHGSVDNVLSVQGLSWISLRVFLPLELSVGANLCDDYDDNEIGEAVPEFTCCIGSHKYHLHTHAPADHIVYHLGKNALTGDSSTRKALTVRSASYWNAIQSTRSVIAETAPLKIRIPGGRRVESNK